MARIREVWAPNLEAEMKLIRELVDSFPYIAMVVLYPICYPPKPRTHLNSGHRISGSRSTTHWDVQDVV